MSIQIRWLGLAGVALLLAGCATAAPTPTPPPTPAALTSPIVLYNWEEYMPQPVLDAFADEYGIEVVVQTYASQEEAVAAIRAGAVAYDVAVIANDMLPALIAEGRLAEIDHTAVPNFANISPNFRDLIFDPGNVYSIPYLWGTTGLLVRTDLTAAPVTRWADLWDERYAGKVAARLLPTELLTVALRALGYSDHSEKPDEVEAALQRLVALKPGLRFVDVESGNALAPLLAGDVVLMVGWNGDAITARQTDPAVAYVLPEEGAIAWVDNFVIAADSPNRRAAELFIDFVLRPEISAQIVEAYYYPSANEAAQQFVDPALAADPLLFPASEDTARLTFYLSLSEAGNELYNATWQRFQDAP
jgi:spermidine/putrescine transport system substrate-binding protein